MESSQEREFWAHEASVRLWSKVSPCRKLALTPLAPLMLAVLRFALALGVIAA